MWLHSNPGSPFLFRLVSGVASCERLTETLSISKWELSDKRKKEVCASVSQRKGAFIVNGSVFVHVTPAVDRKELLLLMTSVALPLRIQAH